MTRNFLITPSTRWTDDNGYLTQDAFNQIKVAFEQVLALRGDLPEGTDLAGFFTDTDNRLDALENAPAPSTALTWSSAQQTTSGGAKTFTGIANTATEIVVAFRGVSLTGNDDLLVQIGGATFGIATSGYNGNSVIVTGSIVLSNSTSGFPVIMRSTNTNVRGILRIYNPGGNLWISDHALASGNNGAIYGGGEVSIGEAPTRLRLQPTGANTFDNGSFYVGWR